MVRFFTFTSAFSSLDDSLHTVVLIHSYLSLSQSLMQNLFPWFRPTRNQGRDYYTVIKEDPRHCTLVYHWRGDWIFWGRCRNYRLGRETAPRCMLHQPRTNRRHQCLLGIQTRILLVLIWLRPYHTYVVLATDFNISITTVFEEIYHVVPILFLNYHRFISWPNLVQ